MSKKIIPMTGMVIVEDEEEKLSSGIVLAEEKDKQSQIGKVVDFTIYSIARKPEIISLNLEDLSAYARSNEIDIGDTIIYKKYSGSEVELEGKKYRLLGFSDIIGKIE